MAEIHGGGDRGAEQKGKRHTWAEGIEKTVHRRNRVGETERDPGKDREPKRLGQSRADLGLEGDPGTGWEAE